jgi:hypothetical protein
MHSETQSGEAVTRAEPRWPVALAIFIVLALLLLMPDRVRLAPPWALVIGGIPVLSPLVATTLRPLSAAWLRIERAIIFAFVAVGGVANLFILQTLIGDMLHRSHDVDGLHLLSSSVAVWITNVLMFSLFYWQVDRGGPALRVSTAPGKPDWMFPQDQAPAEDLRPGWRPQFIDYLFLGFSTATAFSTTDALPLTGRAKFAMMTESAISLVTLAVVAARAINILGS